MLPLALILAVLALGAPPAGSTPARAVAAALAVRGARAEVGELRATTGAACDPDRVEALRPVTGSGEVPVRFTGAGRDGRACEGFGWVKVQVTAPGLVTTRTVKSGEPLEGLVAPGEIELRAGRSAPLEALPAGARAARTLAAGAPVLEGDVRDGPAPGEPITVLVRMAGGMEITQAGRALPCARGRGCALLPGGRRVEGRLEDGHLLLEAP